MEGEDKKIEKKLNELQLEHEDLDKQINAMGKKTGCDLLRLQRLKKRKLWLKDELTKLKEALYPDILA